jgi:hypothetical protein
MSNTGIIVNIAAIVAKGVDGDVNMAHTCVGLILRMFTTMKDTYEVSNCFPWVHVSD